MCPVTVDLNSAQRPVTVDLTVLCLCGQLFRHPQFETYPLEQVAGKCMVMDLNTYCKGRPKGFDPKDIYICEYRVDKTAHLFTKISKKLVHIV